MKRNLTILGASEITVLALLLFLATLPSNAQRNQNASLDEQATLQAKRFFNRMYVKCGVYYYYKYNKDKAFLYQCKYAPTISVEGKTHQPRPLSEADRLNGVDPLPVAWEGVATINLGLCRYQAHYQKDEPGYSAWGDWLDKNSDTLSVTNKKGRWEFYNEPSGREFHTKKVIVPITCDDVPSPSRRAIVKTPYWEGQNYYGNILKVPASYGEWFPLGSGPIKLRLTSSYSQIFIDGTNNPRTPLGGALYLGAQTTAPRDALAPGLKLGAIIVKIGPNGEPFQPFGGRDIRSSLDGFQINSDEDIFIAINDSYFPDNRGEHVVVIHGRNFSTGQSPPDRSSVSVGHTSERLGLRLDTYCKSKHGDAAIEVYTEGDAFSWRCMTVNSDGLTKYFGMDLDEACRMQYGAGFRSVLDNPQDQRSWRCVFAR